MMLLRLSSRSPLRPIWPNLACDVTRNARKKAKELKAEKPKKLKKLKAKEKYNFQHNF